MPPPVFASVHEAAASYQVGTGLFLMRLKRRLLDELADSWLMHCAQDVRPLRRLIELTRQDIASTARFLGEEPLEAHDVSIAIHPDSYCSMLVAELRPLMKDVTLLSPNMLADARCAQLRSYVRELRERLEKFELSLKIGRHDDQPHNFGALHRSNLRKLLDCLVWPFFFLSYRFSDTTYLTTWIPTAPLHSALFRTSNFEQDGIALYPTLNCITPDYEGHNDLSQILPTLRPAITGEPTPFGLVQELDPKRQSSVGYRKNLIKHRSPAPLPDLHFLNISSLSVPVTHHAISSNDAAPSFAGVLHVCSALTRVAPYWLQPCEHDVIINDGPPQAVTDAAAERLRTVWDSLGGAAFVEEMRKGLEPLLAEPSRRVGIEVSLEKDARIQSQITTTHTIKGMANDLLTFAGWAASALDDFDNARTLTEAQYLADVARERLFFTHTEIALIAATAEFAHEIAKQEQNPSRRSYFPISEPEAITEGVLHLYFLLLRERLSCDPDSRQRAHLKLIGDARINHEAALRALALRIGVRIATKPSKMGHDKDDTWREVLREAVRHNECRPIFLGLSEAMHNIRRIADKHASKAQAEIQLAFRRIERPGARLCYVLSQYQSAVSSEAIAAVECNELPNGLMVHNSKYGTKGFGILETELMPTNLLQTFGLEPSDHDRGELRYHLLLRFGVDNGVA